jgi:MSHA biogenesis protein MshL
MTLQTRVPRFPSRACAPRAVIYGLLCLFVTVLIGACAAPVATSTRIAQTDVTVEDLQQAAVAREHADPVYKTMQGIYISDGQRLPVPRNARLPSLFSKEFTLRAADQSVRQIASQVSAQTGLAVIVAPELSTPATQAPTGAAAGGEERMWSVDYGGSLLGFLDAFAAQFGAYWDYEAGSITVFRTRARVFALSATPGTISFKDRITNESSVGTNEAGGAGAGSTAQSASTAGGYQQVEISNQSDIWVEVVDDVKAQLSSIGKVDANPAAGIITVSDIPPVLDRIEHYIAVINNRLSRQVALTIRLYAVTMSTDDALGFSLDAVFSSANGVRAGFQGATPFTAPTGIATANAVVLPAATGKLSKFVDTELIVQALRASGRIAQVTETSVITRNNRTAPVQQTNTKTYIAQTSTVIAADAGSSTTLVPGTVVSGFSGLITPHLLDDGRVLLQYGVNLVVLNEIVQLTSDDQTIGGPDYVKRAFDAELLLRPGETLVVVPYKEEINRSQRANGLLSWLKQDAHQRVVVVMTVTCNVLPA